MNDSDFIQYVQAGIDELPKSIQEKMHNIAIVIADEPTADQRLENDISEGETLFGLYEGVPLSVRGIDPMYYPDKITIFKKPILALYTEREDIAECVANTVWHEVAHHFGYDEEWIAKEEEKRGKIL